MSILHAKFLIHWTGKDFDQDRKLELSGEIGKKYLERLRSCLRDGFYMKLEEEEFHDAGGGWIRRDMSRVCFSELKLSKAVSHAKKYGLLGIGVSRDFVLERYGNPVFYVYNGRHSNLVLKAREVRDFLETHNKAILGAFEVILAYFKKMNEKDKSELSCYDELEWRVTHLDKLEENKILTVADKSKHIYRLKLKKEDVKVIVFPDKATKDKALEDGEILRLIDNPICVTVSDCEHF